MSSLDPSVWASNRDSQARVNTISRLSMTSSVTSTDLHRTSSTSSNHSSSTDASSIDSVSLVEKPRHRKTLSTNSAGLPRRLLKKSKPQGGRQRSDSAPTSSPYDTSVPSVPYIPTRPPPPPPPPRSTSPVLMIPVTITQAANPTATKAQIVKAQVAKPEATKAQPAKISVASSEPSSPTSLQTTVEWQCSDLVVRCKNDVYHVDRDVMCYHSRWFARICTIIKSPVSIPEAVHGRLADTL